MSQTMIRDLTKGNVTKLLLQFAFPLFLSNALQAIYNIVDMIVVGQYIGGAGMSAVSIGGDILHLLTFVAMGFSSAGQVLIAQDVGAGNLDRVRRTIGTLFTFLLAASVSISIIFFLIRNPLLLWVNTPAESYQFTLDYMVICIVGLVFIYGYNIVSAILRGMGDSRRPFVFVAIAAVLNLILDILFVAVFDMKVFGAALATVIGQAVSFIVSLVYLYRHRASFCFDFKLKSFAIDRDAFKRIAVLGVPMAIQAAAVHFSKIVLMSWINMFGVVYSALAGIYNKINLMIAVISNSFTTAGSAMVGQNLGAKKDERIPEILKTVTICGFVVSGAAGLVILFFPQQVFSAFTGDGSVLAVANVLIWPIIVNFIGSATRSVSFSLINGSGNTKMNLAVAIIDGIIGRIGIAALLGFALKMDCLGFWYGDALAGHIPFFIGLSFYLSGKWRTQKKTLSKPAEL
ncbi:MAG: MATE family efflux transporter [Clostridia bacterium]|nr:MATE family efflux transporter [Clostridia bacterium]